MAMSFRIPVGAEVAWISGAQGVQKHKQGKVIAHIPAGHDARRRLDPYTPKTRLRGEAISTKNRYLVEVRVGKSIQYYTPLQSVIEDQNRHLWR